MQWVDPTAARFVPGQGHIQSFFSEGFLLGCGFDAFFFFCKGCLQACFCLVDGFADQRAHFLAYLPH